MSTPLPGQRGGQRPLKAAMATQRAIGRSLTSTGVMTEGFLLHINGQLVVMTEDAQGVRTVEPYQPPTTETEE
jgi:hypothetical protein